MQDVDLSTSNNDKYCKDNVKPSDGHGKHDNINQSDANNEGKDVNPATVEQEGSSWSHFHLQLPPWCAGFDVVLEMNVFSRSIQSEGQHGSIE